MGQIEYALQKRAMSSNVITRKLPGNKKPEVFIMCSHPKKDGDKMIARILEMLNPELHAEDTEDDLKVIAQLMNGAREEGLLTEVIWSALQCNSGSIRDKIIYGYNEWIK